MAHWHRWRYATPAVIVAALLVRLAALYVHPITDSLLSDMRNYAVIANQLRSGMWDAKHFFQPIGFRRCSSCSCVSSPIGRLRWAPFQVAISTATVWLASRCARTVFGPQVGLLTAVVGAFHVSWGFSRYGSPV